MSAEGDATSNRRGEPRVAFDGAVRLRYRLFQEFLEENAANISSGGMFIRTIHPGDLGSELDFEIRLDDDFTLIQGRGVVAWVRRGGDEPSDEPGTEPGMGIRFVELAADSRTLVDRIVRERVAAGLELFDLEGHAPAAQRPAVVAPMGTEGRPVWKLDGELDGELDGVDPAPSVAAPEATSVAGLSPATEPEPQNLASLDPDLPRSAVAAGSSRPVKAWEARTSAGATARGRSGPFRLIAVAVLSAFVGAGAVLTFYWFFVQPSIDALETRIDELAGSPGGPWQPPSDEPDSAAAVASVVDETEAGEVPPAVSERGQNAEVVDALRRWAAAWTAQEPTDYFAFYAAGFEPPDGLDRAAWEESRRARIARPQWIRVALTLVQVEATGPASAEVGFVQSYRSERYKDLVRKRMLMVREDGGWKIAAERAAP